MRAIQLSSTEESKPSFHLERVEICNPYVQESDRTKIRSSSVLKLKRKRPPGIAEISTFPFNFHLAVAQHITMSIDGMKEKNHPTSIRCRDKEILSMRLWGSLIFVPSSVWIKLAKAVSKVIFEEPTRALFQLDLDPFLSTFASFWLKTFSDPIEGDFLLPSSRLTFLCLHPSNQIPPIPKGMNH